MMISIKSIFFQTLFIKKHFFKIFVNTFSKNLSRVSGGAGGVSWHNALMGQWGLWKIISGFIDAFSQLLWLVPCLTLPIILILFPWFCQYSYNFNKKNLIFSRENDAMVFLTSHQLSWTTSILSKMISWSQLMSISIPWSGMTWISSCFDLSKLISFSNLMLNNIN